MILVTCRQCLIFLCTTGPADPSSTATVAGRCWFFSMRYSDVFPSRSLSLFSSDIALHLPANTTSVTPSACALLCLSADFVHPDVLGSTNLLPGEKVKKVTIDSLICF